MILEKYDFQSAESFVQNVWEQRNSFATVDDEFRKKLVISLPPPNVTGRLHMGHALNNTLQDFLIRYNRMLGNQTLWIPGMDHAGIATQSVVKRFLKTQGTDFKNLSREEFLTYVWDWKKKYGNTIYQQMKQMGTSCDFTKSSFTMDSNFSDSVLFAFDRLYKGGLIYKGKRIVNWCPVDKTALSDEEVDRKEGGESGFLWSILYKFPGSDEGLVVGTTRPETLFGDVAIAVHPEDVRYTQYIGKRVLVPILQKEIPIIEDSYVEKDFGTGCVKISPAHDPNDFLVGKRHKLSLINIMNEDATMNENVPPSYQGLSRESCRKNIIAELKTNKQLVAEEKRTTPIARSYRSGAIIEYRVSDQWFIRTKPLVEKLLPKLDKLRFMPSSWESVFLGWLERMEDWCISRQIFWGHQIPVWKNINTEKILVDKVVPKEVLENPDEWQQESDVLDTWFSSALWPMANLGWPKKTPDFKKFFPNQVVFTAKDIIFFWIARMCLFSSYFEDKLPFETVFVHPTITDEKGQRMSKSKGNGIDPNHIIQGASIEELEAVVLDANPHNAKKIITELQKKHPQGVQAVGADALRFTLLKVFSSNQEIRMSFEDFPNIGRKFVTKFWNASRLVLEKLDAAESFILVESTNSLEGKDIGIDWILYRYNLWIEKLNLNCEMMNFMKLGEIYHQFIWNDFCDWFLEISKIKLREDDVNIRNLYAETLLFLLDGILRCLHPIIPFITEYVWSQLQNFLREKNIFCREVELARSPFPEHIKTVTQNLPFEGIIELISNIRSTRSDYELSKQTVNVYLFTESQETRNIFLSEKLVIDRLGSVCIFDGFLQQKQINKKWLPLTGKHQVYMDFDGKISTTILVDKLEKSMRCLESEIQKISSFLSDIPANDNIPSELIQKRKERVLFIQEKQTEIKNQLKFLKSL